MKKPYSIFIAKIITNKIIALNCIKNRFINVIKEFN